MRKDCFLSQVKQTQDNVGKYRDARQWRSYDQIRLGQLIAASQACHRTLYKLPTAGPKTSRHGPGMTRHSWISFNKQPNSYSDTLANMAICRLIIRLLWWSMFHCIKKGREGYSLVPPNMPRLMWARHMQYRAQCSRKAEGREELSSGRPDPWL